MNWKDAKLNEISQKIENLKFMFECKRLFLANYFSELRNHVDLAHYTKIESQQDENLKKKITENWLSMIAFIDSFEKECLKKSPNNRYSESLTTKLNQTIQYIKVEMSNLSLEDENLFDKKTDEIDDLTYEGVFEMEKILFEKKTLFWFDNHDILKDYMNPETMFGKLIFIRNEHFGARGVQSLIKKFCENIEIHKKNNEIVKSLYLSSYLRQMLTENAIDEIEIDLEHLNECFLRNSGLQSLNEKIFFDLNSLKMINLSWNSLSYIEAKTFNNLINLELLDLSGNHFKTFETGLFKGLSKLTCLWFQNNRLVQLEADVFYGLHNLSHIHMSSNKLTFLDASTFRGLSNLKEIVMSNNKWNCDKLRLHLEKSVEFISFKQFWNENNIDDIILCEFA